MKKVFNSCSHVVLFNSLLTMILQKGLVDCISFIKVSLGLFLLLLLVMSLSEFVSIDCGFLVSFSVTFSEKGDQLQKRDINFFFYIWCCIFFQLIISHHIIHSFKAFLL